MGRCCVPNCRGGYDGGPKVRLVSFPADPIRKAQWQRAVRRDDVDVSTLKDPKVCERHFKPDHLRTTSTYTDGDGRTIEVPMKLTRITSDAVPTIFPDCPGYLSSTKQSREEPDVKRRRSENAQLQEAIQQSRAAYEADEANNKLQSLEDISSRFHCFHHNGFWTNVCCDNCIIFAHLEPTTQAPEPLASVTVSADWRVCVFWKHVQLASNEEIDIPGQVLDFRLLENLLDSVQNYCKKRSHQKMDKLFEAEKKIRIQSTLLLTDFIESSKEEKEPCAEALIKKYKRRRRLFPEQPFEDGGGLHHEARARRCFATKNLSDSAKVRN
ncbi:hypothetical protein HPB50_011161 [Hyalomma asiaticum]|uniref:Uncharacterized protein n=1 Tax=Hyalomma asiaticum TaxID=266040 RepID=A0ACB7TES0_HYAAI|nr:hypothetical protein HPB50_011161 [Hyalomma asiaticum]